MPDCFYVKSWGIRRQLELGGHGHAVPKFGGEGLTLSLSWAASGPVWRTLTTRRLSGHWCFSQRWCSSLSFLLLRVPTTTVKLVRTFILCSIRWRVKSNSSKLIMAGGMVLSIKGKGKRQRHNTYIAPQAATAAAAALLCHKQPYAAQVCCLMVSTPVLRVINYMDYSFTDPKGWCWVGLVGWPIADTLLTKWSHVNHRSDEDQGKSASQRLTS